MEARGKTTSRAPVGDKLATHWADFVDCGARLSTLGPFLCRICGEYEDPIVLDAAAGIACESIFLRERGIRIVSNEIDAALRARGQARAESQGIELEWTTVDWRGLCDQLTPCSFDVGLVLGNSLCLLLDAEDRRVAVTQFRRAIRPGGKLVVDERNFAYILSEKASILEGQFRYSGRVMYCGRRVSGRPILIRPELVRFGYFTNQNECVGTLDMYPFQRHELRDLLMKAGFATVRTYADLSVDHREDADFYTHVASA